ncbi:MAG: hypothetical protein K2M19_07670 [Muribaculaceae bacterium]|nr:hypothetical protein [Muribaculaceae bacterium]
MKKIIRHIEFLLMTHDCVIIPGFGAVLSHGREAVYDAGSGRWTPPARTFAFNPELCHNDGLLASSIARRERMSVESALAVINDAVAVMRRVLETEGSVSLGAAGRLSLNSDGRMVFTPGDASALSPALMWLPTVSAPTVARASQLENELPALSRRLRAERVIRRVGGWAACLTILFALGWIVSRNMGLNPGAQFASVLPVDVPVEPAHESNDNAPVVLILATAPADEVIENILPVESAPASAAEKRYCLVVGSFNTRSEAEKFVRMQNDDSLQLLENDGRWRVYAAQGATIEETAAAGDREPIASRYPSHWVCRR